MKKDTHPEYRDVVFEDVSSSDNIRFIIGSTIKTKEKVVIDGVEYPYYKMDTSSATHPQYTGAKNKIMDTAGRVEKFNQRFSKYQRNQSPS